MIGVDLGGERGGILLNEGSRRDSTSAADSVGDGGSATSVGSVLITVLKYVIIESGEAERSEDEDDGDATISIGVVDDEDGSDSSEV